MMMTSFLRACRLPGALVLLTLSLSTAACSDDDSPTSPSDIPQAAGTWTGTYRIRTCTATVDTGTTTVCTPLTGPTAPTQPVRLTLQQTENQVVGNLEFSGWLTRSLVVTGIVQEGGGVVLTGSMTSAEPGCPSTVQNRLALTFWVSLLNRGATGMTGDFNFNGTTRVNACVFADVAIEADTLSLTKQ